MRVRVSVAYLSCSTSSWLLCSCDSLRARVTAMKAGRSVGFCCVVSAKKYSTVLMSRYIWCLRAPLNRLSKTSASRSTHLRSVSCVISHGKPNNRSTPKRKPRFWRWVGGAHRGESFEKTHTDTHEQTETVWGTWLCGVWETGYICSCEDPHLFFCC